VRRKKKISTVVKKEAKNINDYRDEQIGMITIQTIRDLDMCEIVMETDDDTFEKVASMGKELIKADKQELFGYAVKKAIEDTLKERGVLK
jgi:uncharacterized protein YnzC (UPF0291/DUF896 family)